MFFFYYLKSILFTYKYVVCVFSSSSRKSLVFSDNSKPWRRSGCFKLLLLTFKSRCFKKLLLTCTSVFMGTSIASLCGFVLFVHQIHAKCLQIQTWCLYLCFFKWLQLVNFLNKLTVPVIVQIKMWSYSF